MSFIISFIVYILTAGILMYLIILGANKTKTEEEIEREDEEQIIYLKDWREKNEQKKAKKCKKI